MRTLLVFLSLALISCQVPLATKTGAHTVEVEIAAGGARSLIDDALVASVSIEVLGPTGLVVGSGELTKETTSWKGTISVSITGSSVFGAKAKKSDGTLVWAGRTDQVLSGTGDNVSLELGSVTLKGGTVQGSALQLTGYVSTFSPSTSGWNWPHLGITTDGTNLYVADTSNNVIRKVVIATGTTSVLAGQVGSAGNTDNADPLTARFNYPLGITTDGTNLYIAAYNNGSVRQISLATGAVTTLESGLTGSGLATDGTYVFLADHYYSVIYKILIATGATSVLAGVSGTTGHADGTGSGATFFNPYGLATDGTNLYVADKGNKSIRKIVIASGVVTTLAGDATVAGATTDGVGTAARFKSPIGLTTDGTDLYIADSSSNSVRKMNLTTLAVSTLAGGSNGNADGLGTAANFNGLNGIVTDGVHLYTTDTYNSQIRRIQ